MKRRKQRNEAELPEERGARPRDPRLRTRRDSRESPPSGERPPIVSADTFGNMTRSPKPSTTSTARRSRPIAGHDRVRVPDGRVGEVIGFYRTEDEALLIRFESGDSGRVRALDVVPLEKNRLS